MQAAEIKLKAKMEKGKSPSPKKNSTKTVNKAATENKKTE